MSIVLYVVPPVLAAAAVIAVMFRMVRNLGGR
jgi:hypothetical protein